MGGTSPKKNGDPNPRKVFVPLSIALVGWYVASAGTSDVVMSRLLLVLLVPSVLFLGSYIFITLSRQLELRVVSKELDRIVDVGYSIWLVLAAVSTLGVSSVDRNSLESLLLPAMITVSSGLVALVVSRWIVLREESTMDVSAAVYRTHRKNGTLVSFLAANPSVVDEGFVVRGRNETITHDGRRIEADIVGNDANGTETIVDVVDSRVDEIGAREFATIVSRGYPDGWRVIKAAPTVTEDGRRVLADADIEVVELENRVNEPKDRQKS